MSARPSAFEMKVLLAPTNVTAGGVTGSFVDLQDFLMGPRNIKCVWSVGAGTTAGTASGLIQQASTTAGTDATTLVTFSNVTSAGGSEEAHAVPTKRYVRFVGDAQTAKDMNQFCAVFGDARFKP